MKNNLINGQKPEFGNLDHIKFVQKEENDKREAAEMKEFYDNLSPAARAFQAFFEIDMAIAFIQDLTERITTHFNGRKPIDIMFDKSTGYDKSIMKGFLLQLEELYKSMIPNFKLMGDEEKETEYKGLLEKIKAELKLNYKKIKPIDLPVKKSAK